MTTSIITGDIINSRRLPSSVWMPALKDAFNKIGKTPKDWEIYRGDEFQLEIKNPEEAFLATIKIKALLKILKLDARMSIGVGNKNFNSKKITESNGTAFVRSGELFEILKKEKTTLAISSGNIVFDHQMNLMFQLALSIINNWLPQSAEFVLTAIENTSLSQEEIGQILGINQAAVSRRQTRSQFDLIMETEKFYRQQIRNIIL